MLFSITHKLRLIWTNQSHVAKKCNDGFKSNTHLTPVGTNSVIRSWLLIFLFLPVFCLVSPQQEEGRVQEETKPRFFRLFPRKKNPKLLMVYPYTVDASPSFLSLRDVFFETGKILSFCRSQLLKDRNQSKSKSTSTGNPLTSCPHGALPQVLIQVY